MNKESIEKTVTELFENIHNDKIEFLFLVWHDSEKDRVRTLRFAKNAASLLGQIEIEKQKLLWQVIDKDGEEDEKTNV
jgi:hypothetical protein